MDAAKKLVENKGYGEGYPEELYGVRECSWNGKMDDFGYTIQDLSGDGIPELAIVHKKDKIVLALYTLVNGAPSNTFYSWSRSRNYYAGGSSFVFEGSMSASSSVVGTFSISQDGRNVVNKQTYHNQPTSKFDSQKQTLPSTSLSQWK